MNADRRKQLDALAEVVRIQSGMLDEAKNSLEMVKGALEGIKEDEQSYLDNMPEAFQQAERGQNAEAAISEMEEAISRLEEACEHIESAKGD